MAFTKAEFDKVVSQAEEYARADSYETAMAITQQKVMGLDQQLVTGKWVEELREVANRYERIFWQKRNNKESRELPYAD